MTVNDLVQRFDLYVAAGKEGLDHQVQGGYCGDLLSGVMANATEGCVWLTVQVHQNIVAVAALKQMAAVVLTDGQTPDEDTQQKADKESIPLLLTSDSAFDLAGRLHEAGVKNSKLENA
jgi:predicted transcriptional regulator